MDICRNNVTMSSNMNYIFLGFREFTLLRMLYEKSEGTIYWFNMFITLHTKHSISISLNFRYEA